MWAISQENPAMEIAYFERMGLNGLSSNHLILLESRLLRGSSLLVHALSHFCFLTSLFIHSVFLYSPFPFLFLYSLYSSLFFFLPIFLTCFSLLSTCLSLFLLLLTVNILGLFILPTVKNFIILPLNYFWPGVGVLPRLPTGLLVAQSSPLPYTGRAMFHSQTKEFCFVFLLSVASPSR